MQVKEFVQAILDDIALLPEDKNDIDILVRLESILDFEDLQQFLESFLHNEDELSIFYLNIFGKYLSKRWQEIKNTDSSYLHSMYTRISRACITTACYMEETLQTLMNGYADSYYTFLMPPVCAGVKRLSRRHIGLFQLHEFVLADDGTLIEVEDCLNRADADKTTDLYHPGFPNRKLSAQEKYRVIHHSPATENYYDAIDCNVQYGVSNDLLAAKKCLHDEITDGEYKVFSSYGDEGRKRQLNKILSNVKTQGDFTALMLKLPACEWKNFLVTVNDADLDHHVLQEFVFIDGVQHAKSYNNDIDHDKAVLMALTEIYIRQRMQGETYANPLGYFTTLTRKYIGFDEYIQNREEKIAAAEALQEFLMSQQPFSELENYFSTPERKKYWHALTSPFGELSWLTQQIIEIRDPKFFQPKATSWFRSSVWR